MRVLDSIRSALPPIYVIHFVTHRCNLFCEFCCDGHNRLHRDELSLDEITRFYRSLRAVQLSITGGEPTLRKDLTDILIAALAARVHSVSLNSNGLLPARLEEMVANALAASDRPRLKVNVSLDGFRDKHDQMRGKPGAFDATMESYERLVRLQDRFPGLSLRVNTVVTHDNLDQVAAFRGFVRVRMPRLADQVFSLHRTPPGGTVDPEVLRVYQEVTGQHVSERALFPRQALLKRLHDRMYENINALAEGKDSDFRCPAGGGLVEVAASGEVLGCEVLPKEQALLGHLAEQDYDLARILRGEPARAFRDKIARERCACSFECAHITAASLQLPGMLLPRRQRAS